MLFIVTAVAACGYLIFRYTKSIGNEAVRAHAYLTMRRSGLDADQANAALDEVMSEQKYRSAAIYNAKYVFKKCHTAQKPVIGYAYRRGMRCDTSSAYKSGCLVMDVPASALMLYEKDYGEHTDTTAQHTSAKITYSTWEEYEAVLISEIKRLDGKAPDQIHYVQMMDDEGFKRAHAEGIDPKKLATMFLEHIKQNGLPDKIG